MLVASTQVRRMNQTVPETDNEFNNKIPLANLPFMTWVTGKTLSYKPVLWILQTVAHSQIQNH